MLHLFMTSRCQINVEGSLIDCSFNCNFLLIYALNDRGERRGRDEHRLLKKEVTDPILAIRDFNEVLYPEKRKWGLGCQDSMDEFSAWVQEMRFIDYRPAQFCRRT